MFYVEEMFEPLVSVEDLKKAQQIRAQRAERQANKNPKLTVFSGRMKCGYCGMGVSRRTSATRKRLKQARSALERLYTALRGTDKSVDAAGGEAFEARFIEAMDDDFNTPEAYSVLFDMAREVNRLKTEDAAAANAMAAHLRKLASVLGLLEQEPEAFLQSGAQVDDAEVAEIESLIQQRLDARKAKDWAAADAARDRLNEMGIVLEDGPQGTTWRRK